jgi:tetratricopeptide (TPR) repeat protein
VTRVEIASTFRPLIETTLEWFSDCQNDPIPIVDDTPLLPDFWDEWFNPLLEGWNSEVRQELRDFFFQEMQSDQTGIAARYTGLVVYDCFIRYLTSSHWEDRLAEVPRSEPPASCDDGKWVVSIVSKSHHWQSEVLVLLKEDLYQITQFVSPGQTDTWRNIRWEISVSCLLEDWGRALRFYDRARQLNVVPERDVRLLLGQFEFLLAFRDVSVGTLQARLLEQNTIYLPNRDIVLHPFNWEPELFDSPASLLSLCFLAEGLSVSEENSRTQTVHQTNVERAIAEFETASALGPLTAPYQAVLARCYFSLGRFRDAAQQYEEILEGNLPEPWSSLSLHIYRAAATSYVRAGDPTRAIGTLQSCSLKFPTHAELYLRIAELQARQTDFGGVRGTLREATEAISGFDEDWRVSTLLALGELPATEANLAAIKLDADQTKPIEAFLGEYWPRFRRLSSEAHDEWVKGAYFGYFLPKNKSFTVEANRAFVRALDFELEKRVFQPLCKHFVDTQLVRDELDNHRNVGDRDSLDFCDKVQKRHDLSIGQKSKVLSRCTDPSTPIFAAVRKWLDQRHPDLLGYSRELWPISIWRNDTEHRGRVTRVSEDVIEKLPRTCRVLIESIESGTGVGTDLPGELLKEEGAR